MREEFAGAAHSALHFVEYEQGSGAVAKIAQAFEALVGHHANAAFALDRLDDHSGGLVGYCGADGVMIAPWQLGEARPLRCLSL